ncbi:Spc24 subunit of Ndc80-domain-containing protein [Dissophora ornata]|nr:kinetochore-associated Ndc80 complex subunit spc24 [Dissophora ornata]KAI8600216.1 Spc24 subunit of Ndc80-domain-containing protein [Dissophora ornata]
MQQADSTVDEDIVSLIQDVALQFQRSGPDVQNVQRTIQDLRETEKMRRDMLQDSRLLLQKMSRNLQLSRSKGSRQHVDPESLNHDEWMVQMDQKKFAVAKSIQNMDQNIASLEAEVHQLRMQSLELDSSYKSGGASNGRNQTAAERNGRGAATVASNRDQAAKRAAAGTGSTALDQDAAMLEDEEDILDDTAHATAVLRLQLYRGLGIEMLENELGVYSKARVRSNKLNDVHLVKFDDQLSPFFQTNLIWEFAS